MYVGMGEDRVDLHVAQQMSNWLKVRHLSRKDKGLEPSKSSLFPVWRKLWYHLSLVLTSSSSLGSTFRHFKALRENDSQPIT